ISRAIGETRFQSEYERSSRGATAVRIQDRTDAAARSRAAMGLALVRRDRKRGSADDDEDWSAAIGIVAVDEAADPEHGLAGAHAAQRVGFDGGDVGIEREQDGEREQLLANGVACVETEPRERH